MQCQQATKVWNDSQRWLLPPDGYRLSDLARELSVREEDIWTMVWRGDLSASVRCNYGHAFRRLAGKYLYVDVSFEQGQRWKDRPDERDKILRAAIEAALCRHKVNHGSRLPRGLGWGSERSLSFFDSRKYESSVCICLAEADKLRAVLAAATAESGHERQAGRDAAIKAKYAELAGLGRRNYVKEIKRTVPGADSLSDRRIRGIAKGR